SPAVTDKLVVIGSRDNKVHAIDRKTGKGVWTFPTGDRVDSSPVVAGTKGVGGAMGRNVYVLDLAKGKELQRISLGTSPIDRITASPVVVDGKVLIGTQSGKLYCLGAKR